MTGIYCICCTSSTLIHDLIEQLMVSWATEPEDVIKSRSVDSFSPITRQHDQLQTNEMYQKIYLVILRRMTPISSGLKLDLKSQICEMGRFWHVLPFSPRFCDFVGRKGGGTESRRPGIVFEPESISKNQFPRTNFQESISKNQFTRINFQESPQIIFVCNNRNFINCLLPYMKLINCS